MDSFESNPTQLYNRIDPHLRESVRRLSTMELYVLHRLFSVDRSMSVTLSRRKFHVVLSPVGIPGAVQLVMLLTVFQLVS